MVAIKTTARSGSLTSEEAIKNSPECSAASPWVSLFPTCRPRRTVKAEPPKCVGKNARGGIENEVDYDNDEKIQDNGLTGASGKAEEED